MSRTKPRSLKPRSAVKVLVGILGVIFLGALGSGLWQRGISPLLDKSLSILVRLMSFLFLSYKDRLYRSASLGFHEEHSLSIYIFTLSLMFAFYMSFLLIMHRRHLSDPGPPKSIKQLLFPKSKSGVVIGTLFYGSVLVMIFLITVQAAYSNKITTYSLNSIEVLAPYIDEQEEEQFRSDFARATTAERFYEFDEKLKNVAKMNNVELMKFNPL